MRSDLIDRKCRQTIERLERAIAADPSLRPERAKTLP